MFILLGTGVFGIRKMSQRYQIKESSKNCGFKSEFEIPEGTHIVFYLKQTKLKLLEKQLIPVPG